MSDSSPRFTERDESAAPTYTCPGRTMPQPKGAPFEGYVACYRAGHRCPPKVGIVTDETETHITTTYRCPCCGDHGSTFCLLKEWGDVDTDALNRMVEL